MTIKLDKETKTDCVRKEAMTPRWIILLRRALLDRIKEEDGGNNGP